MSFRLQLSTFGKLRNGKKYALVAFLVFSKANKPEFLHGKIQHFFSNSFWGIKFILADSFLDIFYNFYNQIIIFFWPLPGGFSFLRVSLRPVFRNNSFLRLSWDHLWSQEKVLTFWGSQWYFLGLNDKILAKNG